MICGIRLGDWERLFDDHDGYMMGCYNDESDDEEPTLANKPCKNAGCQTLPWEAPTSQSLTD
jgi:hypothetical protein